MTDVLAAHQPNHDFETASKQPTHLASSTQSRPVKNIFERLPVEVRLAIYEHAGLASRFFLQRRWDAGRRYLEDGPEPHALDPAWTVRTSSMNPFCKISMANADKFEVTTLFKNIADTCPQMKADVEGLIGTPIKHVIELGRYGSGCLGPSDLHSMDDADIENARMFYFRLHFPDRYSNPPTQQEIAASLPRQLKAGRNREPSRALLRIGAGGHAHMTWLTKATDPASRAAGWSDGDVLQAQERMTTRVLAITREHGINRRSIDQMLEAMHAINGLNRKRVDEHDALTVARHTRPSDWELQIADQHYQGHWIPWHDLPRLLREGGVIRLIDDKPLVRPHPPKPNDRVPQRGMRAP